jgi:hypothetical protein
MSNFLDSSGEDFSTGSKFFMRKQIGSIQHSDEKLTIVGFARKVNASSEFNADDQTGQLAIRNIPDEFLPIQEGRLYKILGVLSIDGSGMQYLDAKFVEDVTGMNLEQYKTALQLKEKIV